MSGSSKFSFTNISKLYKIFECASCVMVDCNIKMDSYGLSIKGMDGAHVSFIDLFLDKIEFKEWECFEEVIVGINLKNLIRILSVGKDEDEVIFEYINGSDTLSIIIYNDIRRTEYELKLFTIESETLEIPDLDYITTIKLNSSYYSQLLNEIQVIGTDTIEFEILPSKIYINSLGEIAKSKILLSNVSEIIKETTSETIKSKLTPKPKPEKIIDIYTGDKSYKLRYSLPLLFRIKKGLDLSNKVILSLMDNVPLRIEIELSESSFIHYYAAPKIDE